MAHTITHREYGAYNYKVDMAYTITHREYGAYNYKVDMAYTITYSHLYTASHSPFPRIAKLVQVRF